MQTELLPLLFRAVHCDEPRETNQAKPYCEFLQYGIPDYVIASFRPNDEQKAIRVYSNNVPQFRKRRFLRLLFSFPFQTSSNRPTNVNPICGILRMQKFLSHNGTANLFNL